MSGPAPAPPPPPAFVSWLIAHRAADMKKAQERVEKERAERAAEEDQRYEDEK